MSVYAPLSASHVTVFLALVLDVNMLWFKHKTADSGPLWTHFPEIVNMQLFFISIHACIWFVKCFEEVLWLCNWGLFFLWEVNYLFHSHCGCLAAEDSEGVTGILKLSRMGIADACPMTGYPTGTDLTWENVIARNLWPQGLKPQREAGESPAPSISEEFMGISR